MDWNSLVGRLGPRLYNYFIRRGFFKDAADLTQEVFTRLYQKIQQGAFDETRGTLDAFAFGIARFVVLENRPDSQLMLAETDDFDWESLYDPSLSPNLETDYHRNQTIELFLKEIKSLSSIQQEVLVLYMDEELSMDEIATLVNLPIGTIKSHLFRSKEKLKDLLEAKGISL